MRFGAGGGFWPAGDNLARELLQALLRCGIEAAARVFLDRVGDGAGHEVASHELGQRRFAPSPMACTIGLSTRPGATAFPWMLKGPSSPARWRVKPISAALVVA